MSQDHVSFVVNGEVLDGQPNGVHGPVIAGSSLVACLVMRLPFVRSWGVWPLARVTRATLPWSEVAELR